MSRFYVDPIVKASDFYLGVNFWPREANILMWRRWDLDSIVEDLEKLKSIGVDSLRVFLLAEDFAYPSGEVKGDALIKLTEFLDEASKRGFKVFLTLLVGHMSGKNWPFPWDPSNEVYTPAVTHRTIRFIRRVVSRVRGHPAVECWVVSNEIRHVKTPEEPDHFRSWAESVVGAIKFIDERPVSIGDNTSPTSPVFLMPENVGELVDYLSPHIYLYDDDPVRHGLTYMAILEYCLSTGKPTILEEFGFPTNLYTEESHAGFIETILVGSLALGARGALIWCAFDFPREGDEPYLWEPHELSFGLFRSDGSPKPAAESVKRFRELLEILGDEEYELPERDVGILVPATFYKSYPFTFEDRGDLFSALVQAYVMAKRAALNVTFIRETEMERKPLIIVPSVPRLLTTTWRRLLEYVEKGSVLYYSHARYLDHPHVSSCHVWTELFGVKPSLKAGFKGVWREKLELKIDGELVEVPATRRDVGSTGFTPVEAEVVCESGGEPLLLRAKRGRGLAYLSPYPLELYLREASLGNEYKIYEMLAREAGIKPVYNPSTPSIQVEYWAKNGEPSLLFLINHSYREAPTTAVGEVVWGRAEVRGELVIPPKSAVLIRLRETSNLD